MSYGFFFSSRRRHTRYWRDWSSDVCSSDLDLTHPLTTSLPMFVPTEAPSRRTVVTIEQNGYYLQEWRLFEHTGTHVDAPGHFTPGGRLAPELRIDELVTPAVVIDISKIGRASCRERV